MKCAVAPMVGAIVRGDLTSITSSCDIAHWKEALTALLTYSDDQTFPSLAGNSSFIESFVFDYDSFPYLLCFSGQGSLFLWLLLIK